MQDAEAGEPLPHAQPAWPLDGWHVAVEAYQWLRGRGRAPWEQSPDWWKGAGDATESTWNEDSEVNVLRRNRRPLTALALLVALAAGWSIYARFNPKTATTFAAPPISARKRLTSPSTRPT